MRSDILAPSCSLIGAWIIDLGRQTPVKRRIPGAPSQVKRIRLSLLTVVEGIWATSEVQLASELELTRGKDSAWAPEIGPVPGRIPLHPEVSGVILRVEEVECFRGNR